MGLAQTGTGKTAAFVLPILQRLYHGPRGKLRALIVAPTRELAEQTHVAISALGKQTGLRSMTIYGGVSAQPQQKALRAGVDIVVACPGRLLDLLNQRSLTLSNIEVLVLDEADQMFDMGFLPSIRKIVAAVPARRQTLMFSATMPPEIRKLATDMLTQPLTVDVDGDRPVESIQHAAVTVDQSRKTELLLELLHQAGNGQVLIFTRTKHRAKKLAEQLAKAGISATSLQGNLSQNRRQESLDRFRSGQVRVMVATDIAARGIDVLKITHVINYDMPDTAEAYTHRIGRTGRMARQGAAISLITPDDMPILRTIERMLGNSLERRKMGGYDRPTAASVQADRENFAFAAHSNPRPGSRSSGNRPDMRRGGNSQARTAR